MWFRKKMPDAVLTRRLTADGSHMVQYLVHTFTADGKRWCQFHGEYLLLKDDGTVVGYAGADKWEAL